MTKKKTKKLKKNKKEWNSISIRYENHEKKKVTNCCQRHRTKRLGWRLHRGWWKKTSQVPHMIHLSLIWILWSTTADMSENFQSEVKWRQLYSIKCNFNEQMRNVLYRCEILVTWHANAGSIVDQSVIRCNYSDKFSYLKLKDECIDESKSKCICTKWYKTTHRQFGRSSLQE